MLMVIPLLLVDGKGEVKDVDVDGDHPAPN
jgi:hypothetical protein